jgi:hypothetical protein
MHDSPMRMLDGTCGTALAAIASATETSVLRAIPMPNERPTLGDAKPAGHDNLQERSQHAEDSTCVQPLCSLSSIV